MSNYSFWINLVLSMTSGAINFFFSSRRRHTRCSRDWSSDVCSSDLDFDELRRKITPKAKVVAVGFTSNMVGTINRVAEITKLAHAAEALMFVDAVHFAPHGLVDVKALDCDFLVCSPYKFFGPHLGTLYGKREHLERFKPYKVRPATDAIPDCWETGTQVQELIAGIGAAVDYLAGLGRRSDSSVKTRREALRAAYGSTVPYERTLLTRLLDGLQSIPGVKGYGITDPQRVQEPCSTIRSEEHTSELQSPLQLLCPP